MKCPKCGGEMESGTMYTQKYPFWTQQEKTPVLRFPKDMVRLKDPRDDFLSHNFPGTMLCRACKIVVFQYN